ncbi:hypothetical protein HID58_077316 [Brassica napus]|uniref:Protein ENHANCED DISEASE RESISTANCE 2 C-terminal domain-containing protein n=1 Tax=Brassica napus TaxID=3708 RepID=A0ABQ7YQ15_BRANA|nr:hypothetical protein HID58_077316 [Brassica napus]
MKSPVDHSIPKPAIPEWITETTNGGTARQVDLYTGINGWASPPGDGFSVRSADYFTNKQKCPGGDYLLSLAGVDWLKSSTKLGNILARPDNRVAHALRKAQSLGRSQNGFIFAVNFHIPVKEHHHSIVSQVVKGPWIVKAAAGQFGAFLVARTVKCTYHKGPNYFEVDVDTGSWPILAALVRLLFEYSSVLSQISHPFGFTG